MFMHYTAAGVTNFDASSNLHKAPPLRWVGKSYSTATIPTPVRGRPKLRTMSYAGEDKPGPEGELTAELSYK